MVHREIRRRTSAWESWHPGTFRAGLSCSRQISSWRKSRFLNRSDVPAYAENRKPFVLRSAEDKAARQKRVRLSVCRNGGELATLKVSWVSYCRLIPWVLLPLFCRAAFVQSSNRACSKPSSLHSEPASPSAHLPSITAFARGLMFPLLHTSSLTPSSFCSLLSQGSDQLFSCPAFQCIPTPSLSYSHTLAHACTLQLNTFCLLPCSQHWEVFASAMRLSYV